MENPHIVMGLLKVRIDGLTENLSRCFASMLLLEMCIGNDMLMHAN